MGPHICHVRGAFALDSQTQSVPACSMKHVPALRGRNSFLRALGQPNRPESDEISDERTSEFGYDW